MEGRGGAAPQGVRGRRAGASLYKKLKSYYKDINISGYKTGLKVNGWEVSPGWDVKKAILKSLNGKVIADWSKNKLSLWTYSPKFKGIVKKEDLLKRLFFDKKRPDRTLFHFRNQYNFWKSKWGFSLPYKIVKKFTNRCEIIRKICEFNRKRNLCLSRSFFKKK